jgi:hypothetical protein
MIRHLNKKRTLIGTVTQFVKDDENYTPAWFVARFGKFDYDPATTVEKAEEFGITNFDTIDSDGLSADWTPFKRIWVNPPFTLKQEFLAKAWATYLQTKADIYVLFPVGYLTTQQFHNTCGGGRLYIPNGRINFESGLGKKRSSPPHGTVVLKLGSKWSVELMPIKKEK